MVSFLGTETSPSSGASSPTIRRKSVVLPAPFGPDEAHLLAGVELEGRVDEEELTAVLLADARERDHGKATRLARRTLRAKAVNAGFDYREQVGPRRRPARPCSATCCAATGTRTRRPGARGCARGEVSLRRASSRGRATSCGPASAWSGAGRPGRSRPSPLAFAVLHRDEHLLAVGEAARAAHDPQRRRLPDAHAAAPGARALPQAARRCTGWDAARRGSCCSRSRRWRARPCAAAWRTPAVEKVYRALASGVPGRAAFTIDAPDRARAASAPRPVHAAAPDGRPAAARTCAS